MADTSSSRNHLILKEIVKSYISTAEPVGSRLLSMKSKIKFSSATIRNIMADLEEMGLLEQPHVSAGRIPTDKGLRYYVDSLMDFSYLTTSDYNKINNEYKSSTFELETVLEHTSKLLSTLTNYTGIVFFSPIGSINLKKIEFISISPHIIMAVFVTDKGLIRSGTIEMFEKVSSKAISKINMYLNNKFSGKTLSQIKNHIVEEMAFEKRTYDNLLKKAMEMVEKALKGEKSEDIYIGGVSNILDSPEIIKDVEEMKSIFHAFEDKNIFVKILDNCLKQRGPYVIIGSENEILETKDCSIITNTYKSGNDTVGTIGVLGPKRMEYSRAIPLVNRISVVLSNFLTNSMDMTDT